MEIEFNILNQKRDPERIKRILSLVEEAWSLQPDLRLGQLISNLSYSISPVTESFHTEDNKLENALIKFIAEQTDASV